MRLYSETKDYKLYQGNMLDMLDCIQPNTIDSVVTDPPYELNFMGKGWDNAGVSFQPDTWKRCYEVLKPGGYLLAFGGSRTFHRIACAIEDAGFEIRDTIMWIYGSGFPKSMNIGLAVDKKNDVESSVVGQNEWKGWGSCLKPSYEPIIVARKPLEGTLVDNVLTYGVGGLNIDGCRVPFEDTPNPATNPLYRLQAGYKTTAKTCDELGVTNFGTSKNDTSVLGRFPANTILTYDETDYDEVCGGFPNSKGASSQNNYSNGSIYRGQSLQESSTKLEGYREWYNDAGSASRYFYCAKASKKDRDEGLDEFEEKQKYYCDGRGNSLEIFGSTDGGRKPLKNIHPTVKPTELMQYLIRLVTPNGGTILDPFNGSGSTGKAAMYENRERNKDYKYIGIELTEEYLPIAKARIEHLIDPKKLEVSKEEPKPIETKPTNKEIELW